MTGSKKTNPGPGPRESISDVAASLSEPFSLANMLLSLHAHHPTITEKLSVSILDTKIAAEEVLASNSNDLCVYELQSDAIASVDDKLNSIAGLNNDGDNDGASSKNDKPQDDTPMDVEDITNGNDTTSKSTKSNTTTKIVDGAVSEGGVATKTPTKTNGKDAKLPRTAEVGSTKTLQSKSPSKTSDKPPTPFQQSNGQDNSPSRKSKTDSKYHLPEAAEEKASAATAAGDGDGSTKRQRDVGDSGDDFGGTKSKKKREAKPFVMPNGLIEDIRGCTNREMLKKHIKKYITKDIEATMSDDDWCGIQDLVSTTKTFLRAVVRGARSDIKNGR